MSITDNAHGLRAADLTINYDTSRLDLANADVTLGSYLQSQGWSLTPNVDDAHGTIRVNVSGTDSLPGGPGATARLGLPRAGVPPAGTSAVAIDASVDPSTGRPRSRLNDGQLALITADAA